MASEIRRQFNSRKLTKLAFVPFLPFDDRDNLQTDPTVSQALSINQKSCKMLLKSNMFDFASHVAQNEQLKEFLETYLIYRAKPYSIVASSEECFSLDKQVFMIFLRLSSPQQEHRNIPKYYPKPSLSVVLLKGSKTNAAEAPEPQSDEVLAELDSQYADFLSSLTFLTLPHLLDLVSIVGETNKALSGKLLSALYGWKSASLNSEFKESVNETFLATSQLAESAVQLYSSLTHSNSKSNSKKGSSSDKLLATSGSKSQSAADQLTFIASFALDIVFSFGCLLEAAAESVGGSDGSVLSRLGVFGLEDTTTLTALGVTLLDTIKLIYEVVLALSLKISKKVQSGLDQLSPAQYSTVQQYLQITQRKALNVFQTLLSSSCASISTNSHAQSQKDTANNGNANSNARSNATSIDTASWADAIQSKLDVNRVLEGLAKDRQLNSITKPAAKSSVAKQHLGYSNDRNAADEEVSFAPMTVQDTDVMIGALVSDFMQSSSTNMSLLNSVLSAALGGVTDTDALARIEYIIASLAVDDSLLLAFVEKEEVAFTNNMNSVSSSGSSSKVVSSVSAPSAEDHFNAVKSIFPDLGDGFVEACLAVYQNDSAQVIDALLIDNLHPKLLLLDRKTQRIVPSKKRAAEESYTAGGSSSTSSSGGVGQKSAAEKRQQAKEEQAFKTTVKERVKAEERQREQDHLLMQRELASEYNDDYDDQYDDYIPTSKQASAFKKLPTSGTATTASNKSSSSAGVSSSAAYAGNLDEVAELDEEYDNDEEGEQDWNDRGVVGAGAGDMSYSSEQYGGETISCVLDSSAFKKGGSKLNVQSSVFQPSGTGSSATAAGSSSSNKRKEKKASGGKGREYTAKDRAEIAKQMEDNKRFNTMLKGDEVEDAYWAGMRNTNHAAGNRVASKDSWKAELQREADEEVAVQPGQSSGLSHSMAKLNVNNRPEQQQSKSKGGAGDDRNRSSGGGGGGNKDGSHKTNKPVRDPQPKAPQQKSDKAHNKEAKSTSSSAPLPPAENSNSSSSSNNIRPPAPPILAARPGAAVAASIQKSAMLKERESAINKLETASPVNSSHDTGAANSTNTSSSNDKKPRNKTFDKHHQKDKASRKFGSFAPN